MGITGVSFKPWTAGTGSEEVFGAGGSLHAINEVLNNIAKQICAAIGRIN
jgi:hypothetical protein